MLEDPAAERVVLAGTYRSADAFLDIDFLLQNSTFTDETNQVLWTLIKSLRDENINVNIDIPLLRSKARELSLDHIVEQPDTLGFINTCLGMIVEDSNVRRYAAIIRNLEIDRLIYNQLEDKQKEVEKLKGTEGASYSLNLLENMIFDLSTLLKSHEAPSIRHISDGLDEYFEYMINTEESDIVGLSTGYPIWDYILGGCRRGAVNLVGARSGEGKSMLADNVCGHVAGKTDIPTLYLDTEMELDRHWHRLLANISGVPSKSIETRKFRTNEMETNKVRDAKNYINRIPYHYTNISGRPFEETLSYIRRWLIKEVGYDEKGKMKDCLVVYDYLKMMNAVGISNEMKEWQIMGFQMTSLHNFAVKFDIPILSFVQLNKDGITEESARAISQSDRLTWLASSVSIYKRKSSDELAASAKAGNSKMIVIKNRYGEVNNPNEYINMQFDGATARITEGKLSKDVVCEPKPKKVKKEFETDGDEKPTKFKRHKLVRSPS